MSAIVISDLSMNCELDRKAMCAIRGARAGEWTLGWITPFAPAAPSFPFVNFYQVTNNNIFVEEMVNHFQTVEINNAGSNANVNAVLISSLGTGGVDRK